MSAVSSKPKWGKTFHLFKHYKSTHYIATKNLQQFPLISTRLMEIPEVVNRQLICRA